ncbi:flagellar hook-basal body complex protein [Desulfolucanica intricata]|uniref:flagellar hook-basal body complex protein n=1 Tax=Desulfolucanica intricata TaxID=1285191 RepID=UPI000834F9E3|nr:flagellar hook-basal body complex protein [Desulfolucanica intricata]
MIKSLYSGVSGMKNHQIRMDVIGNNIANVNTTAFKAGRVNFKDTLSQLISYNSGAGQGSNKANQVGSGMTLAGIDNIFTQGGLVATGRETDLAIQGNGYFAVQSQNEDGDEVIYYTRDGSFYINEEDGEGYLVNSLGYNVLNVDGEPIRLELPINSININRDGKIFVNSEDTGEVIGLKQFDNQGELIKQGSNLYIYPGEDESGLGTPGSDGLGTIEACNLEMSNVDLTNEFSNMIITQRGYQANSRVITVSDEMLQELLNLKR